ncbi:hypothetical protein NLM16_27895 [Bradyrhizobium brasilense]|uniref:hypothetical protein n=1 Tax=Bradyrhizobium brasilense TaxID=1419277 RepID=UPI002877E263|nr:hypothetical protein [Bradyrhizobium brasilense]MCP3417935.1 hypothetical protein [Bradyrhizobium brasilense]
MKRPKQLPAVDRNALRTAAIPAQSGVHASAGYFDMISPYFASLSPVMSSL